MLTFFAQQRALEYNKRILADQNKMLNINIFLSSLYTFLLLLFFSVFPAASLLRSSGHCMSTSKLCMAMQKRSSHVKSVRKNSTLWLTSESTWLVSCGCCLLLYLEVWDTTWLSIKYYSPVQDPFFSLIDTQHSVFSDNMLPFLFKYCEM